MALRISKSAARSIPKLIRNRAIIQSSASASASASAINTSTSTSTSIHMFHSTPLHETPKVDQVFEKILDLDVIEVHLLTELVNEKMGIKPMTAAQRAAMAGGGGGGKGGAAPAEVVEEKTSFDLKLTGFDAKFKIKVIKEVRAITALGLKEAKEMVEGAPKTVKKDIKMEEAEELKAKLEAVGATVEIS